MTENFFETPQFFLTALAPCPYLEGEMERKMFTHLVGRKAEVLNAILTQNGFRRSQNIAYRPACRSCKACASVRLICNEFSLSRNQKRILKANHDIVSTSVMPDPTQEQYDLFHKYIVSRHHDGSMADMSMLDYSMMVEDTHINTQLIEYRIAEKDPQGTLDQEEGKGKLLAVSLTDYLQDGLSMVYSFFDPDEHHRSLGTYMIIDHIQRTIAADQSYLYLGYWVKGSRKMDYKIRFQPQEQLIENDWVRFDTDAIE